MEGGSPSSRRLTSPGSSSRGPSRCPRKLPLHTVMPWSRPGPSRCPPWPSALAPGSRSRLPPLISHIIVLAPGAVPRRAARSSRTRRRTCGTPPMVPGCWRALAGPRRRCPTPSPCRCPAPPHPPLPPRLLPSPPRLPQSGMTRKRLVVASPLQVSWYPLQCRRPLLRPPRAHRVLTQAYPCERVQ